MTQRFYIPGPFEDSVVELDGAEAHHLLHVMRAQVGTQVEVFDGKGKAHAATVRTLARKSAELLLESEVSTTAHQLAVKVGVALPKGDRQRWLVEKLTELGVPCIVPLITERAVSEPKPSAIRRLERYVIEACKQCGRNDLMLISKPRRLQDWVEEDAGDAEGPRWLAHPGGTPLRDLDPAQPPIRVAIGPEGGFSEPEIEFAEHCGWQLVGLGPHTLRVETAAVAVVSFLGLQMG